MGLMLSLLIGCAGVLEALACYQTIQYGLIPRDRPDMDSLRKTYDAMFSESVSKPHSRSETWSLGVQGYLEIESGRKKGPLKAQIKYLGGDDDPVAMLFSTKVSSFGQESVEYENIRPTTPESSVENHIKTQEPQGHSFCLSSLSPKITPVSSRENLTRNFWDEEEDASSNVESESKEKIQWHYRPITPTEDTPLPEIHFDSYERKSDANNEDAPYSEDFLR